MQPNLTANCHPLNHSLRILRESLPGPPNRSNCSRWNSVPSALLRRIGAEDIVDASDQANCRILIQHSSLQAGRRRKGRPQIWRNESRTNFTSRIVHQPCHS
ncbi:hypothetical protein BLNAU_10380 [Blattamonas nauphoetae]|uniref:Uncharacterized protein n=1 Tax=Blattamonas nauphoetae TaxID=2049346 RepID=A0ABQ9XTD2_9EUKA|nr:hypothetical protein BLNAU_10380 [Blattamonas nauphoetae]